jgi:UDP-glucuronate decarboxylase
VVCLDNLGSGRARNLAPLFGADRFNFVMGDVREPLAETLDADPAGGDVDDPSSLDVGDSSPLDVGDSSPLDVDDLPAVYGGALPDLDGGQAIDRIYHLASRASPADFASHPMAIAETNSQGTRSILSFAQSVDARVLLASTSEVYGDPEVHPQPETYNGNVDPRGERAPYDESKRFAEMLAAAYHRRYGLDVRTARIFNTYGPRMRPDDGRVVPTFVGQALADRPLTVYGDGTQTRSFLYVDDLVRGLRALMAGTGAAGDVYNIGSTDEITIESLAETVLDITGADAGITRMPLPHEDEPERRRPAVERARSGLGWSPAVPLEEGLRRTIDDFDDRYDDNRLVELVA